MALFRSIFRASLRNKFLRNFSTELDGGPIKFTTSPASKWKAQTTRMGKVAPRLWYEPYVILASISTFLTYFCVLREENGIDKELQKTLYSRIAGLEECQLYASLDYNEKHGLETKDILDRLEELKK